MTPITDSKMELRKMGLGNPFFCLPFFCLSIDSLRSPAGSLWLSVSILSALLSPFFCRSTSAEPLLEKTILFTERSDGFTLYRIPGIVVTAKGSVLAYCEARKFSDADRGEIEIHLRRSTDGGKTFSAAKQVAHPGPRLARNPHMPSRKQDKDMGGPEEQTVNNPVAIATRDGTVHLLYCVEYMRAFPKRSNPAPAPTATSPSCPMAPCSAFTKVAPTCRRSNANATGPMRA